MSQSLRNTLKLPFCLTQQGKIISRADFFAHAFAVSQQLPTASYAINLCQNRYLFMVGFLAVLLRQQINLLPHNLTQQTQAYLLETYSDSYCLTDQPFAHTARTFLLTEALFSNANRTDFPLIDIAQPAAISFTSGSTGIPKPISKTWAEFETAAQLALTALKLHNKTLTLVSTVPPQHMYGLETSLFWTLFSSLSIYSGRPFYPKDIALTLQTAGRSLLVSTPAHLKICCQTQQDWQNVERVLSSTAPLSSELATMVEQQFHAPLVELYGSTETLSFAFRRTTQQDLWQLYQGIKLTEQAGQFWVSDGHLPYPVSLDDSFKLYADNRFSSLGRSSDVIKIAGKRASLAELNYQLNQIPAVEDGVFFKTHTERLAALVVGNVTKTDIITALKTAVDAVFLPRAIYHVPKLPRNAIGKLGKAELELLIRDLTDE